MAGTSVEDGTQYYIIKSGDTLSAIAKQFYGDPNTYSEDLRRQSRGHQGRQPDLPGTEDPHSQGVSPRARGSWNVTCQNGTDARLSGCLANGAGKGDACAAPSATRSSGRHSTAAAVTADPAARRRRLPTALRAVYPHALQLTRGWPAQYHSSAEVTRSFCGHCGSPLTYRHAGHPDRLDIMTCSLDDPDVLPPAYHVWTSQKPCWAVVDDRLPAFETTRPKR